MPTPIAISTGMAMPCAMNRPPSGSAMWLRFGIAAHAADRPRIGIGDGDRAEDQRAGDAAEKNVRRNRPQRKVEAFALRRGHAPAATMTAAQATTPTTQLQVAPIAPSGAAAHEPEVADRSARRSARS